MSTRKHQLEIAQFIWSTIHTANHYQPLWTVTWSEVTKLKTIFIFDCSIFGYSNLLIMYSKGLKIILTWSSKQINDWVSLWPELCCWRCMYLRPNWEKKYMSTMGFSPHLFCLGKVHLIWQGDGLKLKF